VSLNVEIIKEGCERALTPIKVSAPEWGMDSEAHVFVRRLRADEVGAIRKAAATVPPGVDEESYYPVSWCLLTVCDADGALLFTESHRAMLMAGPAAPVLRCSSVAVTANGLGGDVAGNSETPPSDE